MTQPETGAKRAPLREYFTMADAQATAGRLQSEDLDELRRLLRLGYQRATAGDALWSNGHTAEGLRLLLSGFDATREAAEYFAAALDVPPAEDDGDADHVQSGPRGPDVEPAADAEAADRDSDLGEREPSDPSPPLTVSADEIKTDGADPVSGEIRIDEGLDDPERSGEVSLPLAAAAAAARSSSPAADGVVEDEEPPDPEAWLDAMQAHGLSAGRRRAVQDAAKRADALEAIPAFDADVQPEHSDLFQAVLTARRRVAETLEPVVMTRTQRSMTRAGRFTYAAIAAAIILAAVWYFALRTPSTAEATASAAYASEFSPNKVVDGDVESEWLLPDRTAGYVEIALSPPRDLSEVRLRNAHNRHYNDRAARSYKVELFAGEERLTEIEGDWPRLIPRPPWTDHEVEASGVTRIRVTVDTWHGLGGGLAEIQWE